MQQLCRPTEIAAATACKGEVSGGYSDCAEKRQLQSATEVTERKTVATAATAATTINKCWCCEAKAEAVVLLQGRVGVALEDSGSCSKCGSGAAVRMEALIGRGGPRECKLGQRNQPIYV